jgi:predicted nucleic acid-binding protein
MTTKFVIDTNVAIVASGRDTHASEKCQDTCKELLGQCKDLHIVIDNIGLILDEYANKLNPSGKPSIGDAFFKYLKNYQYSSDKIQLVAITPINDEQRGFEELPENQLDKSDRKFLATAVVAQATIVNATDSDWTEQKLLLDTLQINVKQLCSEHSCK